jgi:hypothetical protein
VLELWAAANPTIIATSSALQTDEAAALAQKHWNSGGALRFLEDFAKLMSNAPGGSYDRLRRVVEVLPVAIAAEQAARISQQPKAAEPASFELADFSRLFGLGRDASALDAAAALVRKLSEWESIAPLALASEKTVIWRASNALESAMLFSPVAIAVLNGASLPRPPKDWQEEVIVAIGSVDMHRFNQISGTATKAVIARGVVSATNEAATNKRWSRLEPARQLAFRLRAEQPELSRAKAIERMVDEVKAEAKKAGEPLSGSRETVEATITRWFRKAGIK